MRLDKYLSDMGVATRSESKKIIKAGRITIDGEVITDPAFHVSDIHSVSLDDTPLSYQEHLYYMLHKPQGVITATKDNSKKTILDLINQKDRIRELFPVGRLDKDTEGLLLITDDGALAHELLSPKKHVDKTYCAIVTGKVTQEDVDAFAAGLEIDGGEVCLPASLNVESTTCLKGLSTEYRQKFPPKSEANLSEDDALSFIRITIREGKYHQIKRMCKKRGHEVLYLKRLTMGPLTLDESLPLGAYRPLTPEEISLLKS